MKTRTIIYLFIAAVLTACSGYELDRPGVENSYLIGHRVNFNASMADMFVTRATYRHDGSFNEGDQMRIFRQYALNSTFDAGAEAFRTYYLKMDYAAGTQVSLNSDWLPMPGKLKSDDPGSTPQVQTAADSLTWENGKTVRFRA